MPVDPLIILLRFVQYGGAMILFGSSLFLIWGGLIARPARSADLGWTQRLLLIASTLILAAAPLQLLAQIAALGGSWAQAFDVDTIRATLNEMSFAKSAVARTILSLAAVIALCVLSPGRSAWQISACLGALIGASFAWMGHGAATEGPLGFIHLTADILHILSAAAWLGALCVFWLATGTGSLPGVTSVRLSKSLTAFSGTGSLIVALILATGIVNTVFLVGWNAPRAIASCYGQVLAAKLALFLLMLALAAANRFWHAPALARSLVANHDLDISALRRSITMETLAGAMVLAIVGLLGTLKPVAAP